MFCAPRVLSGIIKIMIAIITSHLFWTAKLGSSPDRMARHLSALFAVCICGSNLFIDATALKCSIDKAP